MAGILLALIAVELFLGNWASLASITVATAAALVYRIRIEERALLQSLGDDYRDYAATRKRLVPFVWLGHCPGSDLKWSGGRGRE